MCRGSLAVELSPSTRLDHPRAGTSARNAAELAGGVSDNPVDEARVERRGGCEAVDVGSIRLARQAAHPGPAAGIPVAAFLDKAEGASGIHDDPNRASSDGKVRGSAGLASPQIHPAQLPAFFPEQTCPHAPQPTEREAVARAKHHRRARTVLGD